MNLEAELFSQSSYQLAIALKKFEQKEKVKLVQIADGEEDWVVTTRELFCEVVAVGLGNLYNKIPIPAPLFDPAMLTIVVDGLEENEAGLLIDRTEEWLRYEGLVRIMAGRRNQYVLTSRAISVLSVATNEGALGIQLAQACACYARDYGRPDLRIAVRRLVMTILSALNS